MTFSHSNAEARPKKRPGQCPAAMMAVTIICCGALPSHAATVEPARDFLSRECIHEADLDAAFIEAGGKGVVLPTCIEPEMGRTVETLA
jgi:hypothetical protein